MVCPCALKDVELSSSLSRQIHDEEPEDPDLDFSNVGFAVLKAKIQPPSGYGAAYKKKYENCDVFNVTNIQSDAVSPLEPADNGVAEFDEPDLELTDAAAAMALQDPVFDLDTMLDLEF